MVSITKCLSHSPFKSAGPKLLAGFILPDVKGAYNIESRLNNYYAFLIQTYTAHCNAGNYKSEFNAYSIGIIRISLVPYRTAD